MTWGGALTAIAGGALTGAFAATGAGIIELAEMGAVVGFAQGVAKPALESVIDDKEVPTMSEYLANVASSTIMGAAGSALGGTFNFSSLGSTAAGLAQSTAASAGTGALSILYYEPAKEYFDLLGAPSEPCELCHPSLNQPQYFEPVY